MSRPAAAAREAGVVASIRRRALKHAPHLLVRKLHGSPFSVEGDPDLYGSYRGRAFAVEVKRPGEDATKLQLARLAEWARSGAATGTVHSADEFFRLLGIDDREEVDRGARNGGGGGPVRPHA